MMDRNRVCSQSTVLSGLCIHFSLSPQACHAIGSADAQDCTTGHHERLEVVRACAVCRLFDEDDSVRTVVQRESICGLEFELFAVFGPRQESNQHRECRWTKAWKLQSQCLFLHCVFCAAQ